MTEHTGDPVGSHPMVIAIDGPAGAGKSTVTRGVAERLGILYLDTGAMYRAATVGLLDSGVALDDAAAVAAWVCERGIDFDAAGRVRLDGDDVADRIRTAAVTAEIWRVANNPQCREHLVALQQRIIADRDAALEGRDATTVICPDAPLKIYLDASPEERARRRLRDWSEDEQRPDLSEVTAAIARRDELDTQRAVGALRLADDAVRIATDTLAPDEVIARILAYAVERRPLLLEKVVADQLQVGRSRQHGYVRVAEGSVSDPPAPWQLGLTNPSSDRLPQSTTELARNHGGRQAGVLLQGRAIVVLAGAGERPQAPTALPMLPQSWYVIEPGVWHAVVQIPGTICAWAEASGIGEDRETITAPQAGIMRQYFAVYLRDHL